MTVLESLCAISGYPLSPLSLELAARGRGLDPAAEVSKETFAAKDYRLAKADVLMMLADAPDVTQEGISYSFTDEQRDSFRMSASIIYNESGEGEKGHAVYGYKGDRL